MNSDNTKEAKAEECPDGLLPDGPTCPRCGGKRGPSGVDGGSWVHYRQAASRLAGQGEQPEDEKLLRRALYYLEADAVGRYGIKGLEEIVAAGDHPVVADLRKRLGGSARFPTASLTVPGDAPKGEGQ